jgi:hypothetical protein
MFPATLPELAEAKKDAMLDEAGRRTRAADLLHRHHASIRARVAATMTRVAARLDDDASRSVLATGATSRLHGPAGAGR